MGYSYVTLVSNHDYVIGARALANSLRMSGARWPLTVLATQEFDGLSDLEALGCTILPIQPLPLSSEFCVRHSRQQQHAQAPFTKGNKPQFHNPLDNFGKLRLWELEQFEKVVFLDADTLVIRNIDRLFTYPEFVAAPNVYESMADFHRMNSGVFVAQPNKHTFAAMIACLDQPGVFWSRTDQTFLQSFFPNWHGLPYIYNTLQYVWFHLPQLWAWDSIHVVHYQYEKPWEVRHPKAALLAPLIDLWWHVLRYGQLPAHLPTPMGRARMNSRRALVLDFDGVLVDSEPVNFAAWNQAFDEILGLRLEDSHRIAVGLTLDETYELWTRAHPALELTPALKHKLLERKMELFFLLGNDCLRPMPGSIELIRGAQAAGWYVMVASRARRARLLRTLDLIGVPALFDLVLGAEDLIDPATDRKDHARPPRLFNIDPAACIVVEDSVSGVEDARQAGIGWVVGLTTSLDAQPLLAAGAHQVIDCLADLRLPARTAAPAHA